MAILPVNSINFNNRSNVSFARKNDTEGAPVKVATAPFGKTVPVIVLMATMNPSLLKSAATMSNLQGEEGNPEEITMVAPAQVSEPDEATYVMEPIRDKIEENYPLNVAYFSQDAKIQQIIPCTESGVKGNIVFAKSSTRGKDKEVQDVYIIRHNYKSKALHGKPPWIAAIIYHNLGGNNSFIGALVTEQFPDGSYQRREAILDNKSAQQIVNLMADETCWVNNTNIGYMETKSPELIRASVY